MIRWLINTILLSLDLLDHQKEHLLAILDKILPTQKQILVQKWQQVLGGLDQWQSQSKAVRGSSASSKRPSSTKPVAASDYSKVYMIHLMTSDGWMAIFHHTQHTSTKSCPSKTSFSSDQLAQLPNHKSSSLQSTGPLLWRTPLQRIWYPFPYLTGTMMSLDPELVASLVQPDVAAQMFTICEQKDNCQWIRQNSNHCMADKGIHHDHPGTALPPTSGSPTSEITLLQCFCFLHSSLPLLCLATAVKSIL